MDPEDVERLIEGDPHDATGDEERYPQDVKEEYVDMVEDEDEDEDSEDDAIDANHHLLDRVQKALFEQLSKRKTEIEEKIRDRREAVLRIKKEREQTGVELYGYQQQLAKSQQDLESKHDLSAATNQAKEIAEKKASYLSSVLDKAQEQEKILEKKRFEEQKKLDQIKITVKRIEDYNQELKGEIQVTRRAAYGTEEGMKEAEKEKKMQDYLIDETNEQIKRLLEQTRLFEGQISSQAEQTVAAKETLREAEKEIEKIAVQKREYMQRWKTSLIGMKRRDESLQTAIKARDKLDESAQGVVVETLGIKKAIVAEQTKNEILTGINSKTEIEVRFLEGQNEKALTTIKDHQEQYEMVVQSLTKCEDQLKRAKQVNMSLRSQVNSVHKKNERIALERRGIEQKIELELKGEVDTLKRGKQNVSKSLIKLRRAIREKEIDIAEAQNELARIRVDVLNTSSLNKQLKEAVGEYETDLKEKDAVISNYESEIKSRNLVLERKQMYIVRLNKKYDELTANQDEENTGPLEAVIKTLRKDIEQRKSDTSNLQRTWIGQQNKLVNLVQATEKVETDIQNLRSRISVLEQKALRVQNESTHQMAESRALEGLMQRLHHDARKLNSLISESEKLSKEIASTNYTTEQDFASELKQLEKDSNERVTRQEALVVEKENLIQNVVETERQIMLLEKKIQLERETHAALDPEFGQPEIKGMKKEIHRMELRLIQLKKQQEKMIQAMERTIMKREMIQKGHEASKSKGDSRISLRKKISGLKSALRENIREFKKIENQIQRQEEASKSIFADVENMRRKFSQVEDTSLSLESELQMARLQKRLNSGRIMLLEKRARRSQELIRKKSINPADIDLAAMGLAKETEMRHRILEALGMLQDNQPKLAASVSSLREFLNEA